MKLPSHNNFDFSDLTIEEVAEKAIEIAQDRSDSIDWLGTGSSWAYADWEQEESNLEIKALRKALTEHA